MKIRAVLFVVICVTTGPRFVAAAAEEYPESVPALDLPEGTAGDLSHEEMLADARLEQSAQPTLEFYQTVADHQYIRDRNSAPCAEWAVVAVDFRNSRTGAALAGDTQGNFFEFSRDSSPGSRPDPRGCSFAAGPSGAESVHLYPGKRYSVLATHFYRFKDSPPPEYEADYALSRAIDSAEQCVLKESVDPDDASAVSACANQYLYRPGQAPWAALLIIAPAFAGNVGTSGRPAGLPLQIAAARLQPDLQTDPHAKALFYVLSK